MNNIYYNSTRVEILKRLKYLNEQKYVDFFRESLPFMLSLYITYFGLAEDLIIEKDSKDYNINTRLTKHINDKYLKNIFPSTIPIQYIKKESNSMEWILSSLRNAIFHNGIEVNYKDKQITAKNNGFLNNLECTIPFEWFENFITKDIIKHIELDNYTYHLFIPPFKTQNVKKIQNYKQLNEYIEQELHGIVIEIKYDENSSNLKKIEREEFIIFTESIKGEFYSLFYSEVKDNKEFNILKEKIKEETKEEKKHLNDTEYEQLLYFKMFKEFYTNKFMTKYSNYNLTISKFENKKYAESLFKRGKDRVQFFKKELPHFQGMEIARLLSKKFNHDKIEYLHKIFELCTLYEFCSKEITSDYKTDKFMEKVIKPCKYYDPRKLEEEYVDYIKKELERKNITQTYDIQITEEIISMSDFLNDDIYLRYKEIANNFTGDKTSNNFKFYIKDILKQEFPNYYEKENNTYKELGTPSDQVREIYLNHNVYAINNAKGILTKYRDDILESLLYTLGINTYVMNKEVYLKNLDNKDYKFMDNLKIKGYSHDLYNNSIALTYQKRSGLKTQQKKILKTIKGLSVAINKINDINILNHKKQELMDYNTKLNSINADIQKYDYIIANTKVIEREGTKLQETSNLLCATIIRNCFAHCDRIHIKGRDKTGEIIIELNDYDNNGNLSGIVETNLSSLINFLTNDTFEKEINKTLQKKI